MDEKLDNITKVLNQLRLSVQSLNSRITKLEVGSTPSVHQPAPAGVNRQDGGSLSFEDKALLTDYMKEFDQVKDSVARIALP